MLWQFDSVVCPATVCRARANAICSMLGPQMLDSRHSIESTRSRAEKPTPSTCSSPCHASQALRFSSLPISCTLCRHNSGFKGILGQLRRSKAGSRRQLLNQQGKVDQISCCWALAQELFRIRPLESWCCSALSLEVLFYNVMLLICSRSIL